VSYIREKKGVQSSRTLAHLFCRYGNVPCRGTGGVRTKTGKGKVDHQISQQQRMMIKSWGGPNSLKAGKIKGKGPEASQEQTDRSSLENAIARRVNESAKKWRAAQREGGREVHLRGETGRAGEVENNSERSL